MTITVNASDPARNLTGTRQITGGLGTPAAAAVLQSAVSGASFAANLPLAPGSLISLFGQNLADGTASAPSLPLGTLLAGATAVMAGNPLPLDYSSSGQINAAVPFGINTNTSHQILVQRDNTLSVPIPVNVGSVEPAIFAYPAPGEPPNQGAIVNAANYAVADPTNPVTAGNILAIFCTGLGRGESGAGRRRRSPVLARSQHHSHSQRDHRRPERAGDLLRPGPRIRRTLPALST